MRGIGVGGAGQPLPKLRRRNAQRRSGHGRTIAKIPCSTKRMIKIEPVPLHRATDPDNDSSSPVPDSDKLSVVLQAKATTDQHCTSSPAPGIDEFCPVLQTAATIDQHVSSLPILDGSDARSDLRAHARTVRFWERLLILASLLVAILFDVPTSALRIHEELQRQAQENANDTGLAAQSSLEDWCLIFRAGLASRRYGNYSGHLLPAPNMGCFFVRLEGQTLTVPIRTGAWRADMMQRLREANFPEPFLACLATTEARLHRVRLSDDFPSAQLVDEAVRLYMPGLLGGMPPKKKYRDMSWEEVRALCGGASGVHLTKTLASGQQTDKSKSELVAGLEARDAEAAGVATEAACTASSSADPPQRLAGTAKYRDMSWEEVRALCGIRASGVHLLKKSRGRKVDA